MKRETREKNSLASGSHAGGFGSGYYFQPDQSMQDSGPPSPVQMAKKGFGIGIGSIVRKAASAASMAAKQAYVAASSARKLDDEMLPLKCCLMSICLPWEHLAYDLLLKQHIKKYL
ncbi:hypothetical protein EJ110_NYTH52762 [Nymphaea thermarum]|nr:hypothetical protein EJ110_NYTH52762 [Nymphaea thermarum]